ncbi:flagellar hook-associated protein FlgK [Halomonas sp. HNIBRBA4712]|uniref:flagellar hook-associated protein FlgK n=1 Tax=Halomonas sp. HNIBRBA4712 TaxID=3373087 RepID=UPI0037473385
MSMFSTGLSGLNAAQRALGATSNNISNLFTPGYNRELPKLSETGVGGGVRVDAIERQFNTYVANQLNNARTQSSALETYSNQVSQIDNLLADREAGLSPLMQDFFSSLDALASAPSDPAARQGVIGAADTLSAQFRSFDGYLQDMQSNINGQIRDEVTQINNTVDQIADFNREISLARARSGEAPNSLLNQRDQLVAELNERMDLRLNVQDGKSYNISLPNGQPLVTGTASFKLEAIPAENDPQRTVIGYRNGTNKTTVLDEATITGGSLGGLMSFRAETLDRTQNQLGQIAVSLSVAFNEQHKQGIDLNGEQGGDFFSVRAPQGFAHDKNIGSAEATLSFDADNIAELKAVDYSIKFDGDVPVVTRKDNGQTVESDWQSGTLAFGGIEMTFSSQPASGDRFEVQPVRRAGAGMETAIRDLDRIAAGEEDASGDNRNARKLQDLQSDNIVGGRASLSGAYGALVSDVGNRTNITQVNLEARQGLTDQLRAVQQSESGVNLDEEAANLIRYQQFYMANARVIDTAGTIMDTILNLRS